MKLASQSATTTPSELADLKRFAITNFAFGGVGFSPLPIKHVRGYIIQRRENDPAVNSIVPANMIFGTRKFCGAGITIDFEINLETNWVRFAASETHVCRFNWLCHFELRY